MSPIALLVLALGVGLRPETKVLFTSGYSENAISEGGLLRPRLAFLPKPYTPASMARAVREMLDAVDAPGCSPW